MIKTDLKLKVKDCRCFSVKIPLITLQVLFIETTKISVDRCIVSVVHSNFTSVRLISFFLSHWRVFKYSSIADLTIFVLLFRLLGLLAALEKRKVAPERCLFGLLIDSYDLNLFFLR